MNIDRRSLILGAGAAASTLPAYTALAEQAGASRAGLPSGLSLTGHAVQGGTIIGRTWPGASILVDGTDMNTASPHGLFIVGLDRDAPPALNLEVRAPDGRSARRDISVATGSFPSSRINGLPPSTIAPSDPALLERIRRETALKAAAFASRTPGDDFAEGFVWPLSTYRISSAWGAQRVLNGTPARPHYGIDLAAPTGTVIRAPAAGLVVLARPDLHFEGGLTLIDHGQGLVTAYLHQSAQSVREGQRVTQGQAIGAVGSTGRATGPHLSWRMKWRDRNLDPSRRVGTAPAL